MNEDSLPPTSQPAEHHGHDAEPTLSFVRGQPTAEEVTAVLVVLAARARTGAAVPSGQPGLPPAIRSAWSDKARLVREALSPGPGAWRRSYLPR